MTTKRGMTMVELLLALVLLAGLMVAAASWTQIAGTTGASVVHATRWRQAAETVLQLIHDDLATGDFAKGSTSSGSPRAQLVSGALIVRTRGVVVGPVEHEYRLDSFTGRMVLVERHGDGRKERLLLDQVLAFTCTIIEKQTGLQVVIICEDGTAVDRRYELP
jgi:prepilin-type N-terminal cleavage/methylation domain-containing protein